MSSLSKMETGSKKDDFPIVEIAELLLEDSVFVKNLLIFHSDLNLRSTAKATAIGPLQQSYKTDNITVTGFIQEILRLWISSNEKSVANVANLIQILKVRNYKSLAEILDERFPTQPFATNNTDIALESETDGQSGETSHTIVNVPRTECEEQTVTEQLLPAEEINYSTSPRSNIEDNQASPGLPWNHFVSLFCRWNKRKALIFIFIGVGLVLGAVAWIVYSLSTRTTGLEKTSPTTIIPAKYAKCDTTLTSGTSLSDKMESVNITINDINCKLGLCEWSMVSLIFDITETPADTDNLIINCTKNTVSIGFSGKLTEYSFFKLLNQFSHAQRNLLIFGNDICNSFESFSVESEPLQNQTVISVHKLSLIELGECETLLKILAEKIMFKNLHTVSLNDVFLSPTNMRFIEILVCKNKNVLHLFCTGEYCHRLHGHLSCVEKFRDF